MAYISPSDVALFMNVTLEASSEAYLDALIPQIESVVEAACNRTWEATDPLTETFDGDATCLFPRSTPISTGDRRAVNGAAGD